MILDKKQMNKLKKETENKFPFIKEIHKLIGPELVKLQKFIEEKDILAFAHGGTAIGVDLWGTFIPWDDDADIGIYAKDWYKYKEEFEKYGIDIDKNSESTQLPKIILGEQAFIDLPIFGEIYDSNFKNWWLVKKLQFLTFASAKYKHADNFSQKILKFVSYFMPIRKSRLEKIRKKTNSKKRGDILAPMIARDIQGKHWFIKERETIDKSFNGFRLRTLKDSHNFISSKYPNYKEVPKSRKPSH